MANLKSFLFGGKTKEGKEADIQGKELFQFGRGQVRLGREGLAGFEQGGDVFSTRQAGRERGVQLADRLSDLERSRIDASVGFQRTGLERQRATGLASLADARRQAGRGFGSGKSR